MEQPHLQGNRAYSVDGALPGKSMPGAGATLGDLTMQYGVGALGPTPGSPEGPQAGESVCRCNGPNRRSGHEAGGALLQAGQAPHA